jgi:hypothetical protein
MANELWQDYDTIPSKHGVTENVHIFRFCS